MIGECNSKMNGYAVLLNYRYMNLCVKAEPASLLNVSVVCEDRPLDIEQVADVTISPDDFHFEVYPKDSDLLTWREVMNLMTSAQANQLSAST